MRGMAVTIGQQKALAGRAQVDSLFPICARKVRRLA